jgi:hypothetical protein
VVFASLPLLFQEVRTVGATSQFENKFDRAAFVGEGSIGGTLRLTDHSALRGGYQILWIEDVAKAVNTFTTGEGLGGLLFHGAYAGLELRW